jgi:hypothetical protein
VLKLWQGLGYYSVLGIFTNSSIRSLGVSRCFPDNYSDLLVEELVVYRSRDCFVFLQWSGSVVDGMCFWYFDVETDIALASAKRSLQLWLSNWCQKTILLL